ncbi:leucine-rich repeat-containing protein 58 [Dermacentor andersoni]|uniref:leucine-rich repeat-containing protein 58 n=1 Tax=Dermacentor andersoni TaxID=34620 RepID=UPI002154FB55|nr:leucine-rich repeat-containing protein 58-like [Dermacentor andersoni]
MLPSHLITPGSTAPRAKMAVDWGVDESPPPVVDLSGQELNAESLESRLSDVAASQEDDGTAPRSLRLERNRLERLPSAALAPLGLRLHTLDVSNNGLTSLGEQLPCPSLRVLLARGNRLNELPKQMPAPLLVLNLSGNQFTTLPDQLTQLNELRHLYMGGNMLDQLPDCVGNMLSLEALYLGGNQLEELPASLGRLWRLRSLCLSGNRLASVPASLADLRSLRSLALHDNRLRTLPPGLVRLGQLVELSLRGNPLVGRFVHDLTYRAPSLRELAARCAIRARLHESQEASAFLPASVREYLASAQHCVNPQCGGVYFDSHVERIQFVDFCGKYRLPLLQYLCSAHCSSQLQADSSASSSHAQDPVEEDPDRLRRVLLG